MSSLLIEPHYLGSLEYFSLLIQYENIFLDIEGRFQKQTYRNRCLILGSNKILSLIVPVSYSNNAMMKDVKIDSGQRWKKDHWGAFYSSYGKAPFYEYFEDSIADVWKKDHKYLIDLSCDFMTLMLKIIQKDVNLSFFEAASSDTKDDFRNTIIPKKSFLDRNIYQSIPYSQLFGDNFSPNLSILDLIMCEGPQSYHVLTASFLRRKGD